jgi:hypothetical protein
MTTPLSMIRDINGFNTFGLTFSDTGFQSRLAVGVPQQFTVPNLSNANQKSYLAIFSIDPGTRIYVARNATAQLPTSSFLPVITDLNPTARQVFQGDTLSFITDASAAVINVKLYAIF